MKKIGLICLVIMTGMPNFTSAAIVLPDNGFGTLDLPIHADYYAQESMQIIDGLPAGTTIEIGAVHTAPAVTVEQVGGGLGGTLATGNGSGFQWVLQGTGSLAGFNRLIFVPIDYEVHAAPRTPGDNVQTFDTTMFLMTGQNIGDPDFDLLRITAGNGFGLPSPGHTTLTQVGGGNWQVDSFFDIVYRIDFVGAPGSVLDGMSGSTTGTVRMSVDPSIPEPATLALLALGGLALRKRK